MNVVLLYGGRSGEHEISLMSCSAIARNISGAHNVYLIFIDKDGSWYLQDKEVIKTLKQNKDAALGALYGTKTDIESRVSVVPGGKGEKAFRTQKEDIKADVVLPVLHGTYGEDGTVQGLLEMAGVPYAGCQVFASAAAMDKEFTKIILEHKNIPIVPYRCLSRADINDSKKYDSLVQEAIEALKFPLFVKPCSAGSSDGANRANNERELSFALMEAFSWDNKVLIEKAINAREVECSVMGNSVTADPALEKTIVTAFTPGEIVPKHTFYDYDAKYNDPDGAELKIPAMLVQEKLDYIKETAKKAYKAINASGLARVDFFVDKGTDAIYLNEINTLPGFTSISMFPKMCENGGLDFPSQIECLIAEAIESFKEKQNLCTTRD